MKIIMVCPLYLALVCMSCRGSDPNAQTGKAVQVDKMLQERYQSYPFTFRVRGPVPVTEFRESCVRAYEERCRLLREPATMFEHSEPGRLWARLEAEYREGDALYFFRSDERSWGEMCGREGYVLIRNAMILDLIETKMN
jgi:hypothetical protein